MRLSSTESADMVAKVTGGRTLPPEVLDQIVAKTDGVPLFVEELTTSVIESDLVREQDGRYVLIGQLPAHGAASVARFSIRYCHRCNRLQFRHVRAVDGRDVAAACIPTTAAPAAHRGRPSVSAVIVDVLERHSRRARGRAAAPKAGDDRSFGRPGGGTRRRTGGVAGVRGRPLVRPDVVEGTRSSDRSHPVGRRYWR